MAGNFSHRALCFCLGVYAVVTTVNGVGQVDVSAGDPPIPRVRSDNPGIARLIKQGTERSPTFKGLIDAIDRTDGLVYVEEGMCRHGVLACLWLSVKIAGPNRLLRILVSTRNSECDVTASIGHELRHALEVLSDPNIRRNRDMFFFFHREGATGSWPFDTGEALRVGDRVRIETCARLKRAGPR